MSWDDIIKPALMLWLYLFLGVTTAFLAKLFVRYAIFVAEF